MAEFITIHLKGEKEARGIFQGLATRMNQIAVKPTLEWLEGRLTEAFRQVIGPGSLVYYAGDTETRLWDGLSSQVRDERLTYYEGSPHGGFVRRGTRPYKGGGRAGGYQRLKTWAESKLGVPPAAASRVAWFTLMRGTRKTPSETYPVGSKQYDYPLKVVEVEGRDALQQVASRLGRIVISYVESKQAGLG